MSRPVPANEPVVTSSSLHRQALKELKLSCSFQITVDGNQEYTTAFTLDLNDSDEHTFVWCRKNLAPHKQLVFL